MNMNISDGFSTVTAPQSMILSYIMIWIDTSWRQSVYESKNYYLKYLLSIRQLLPFANDPWHDFYGWCWPCCSNDCVLMFISSCKPTFVLLLGAREETQLRFSQVLTVSSNSDLSVCTYAVDVCTKSCMISFEKKTDLRWECRRSLFVLPQLLW
jgi:hypothetical protein